MNNPFKVYYIGNVNKTEIDILITIDGFRTIL